MEVLLNPFIPNVPFPYHLKTSENRKVFWCLQGVDKGCIGTNGLIFTQPKCVRRTLSCIYDVFFFAKIPKLLSENVPPKMFNSSLSYRNQPINLRSKSMGWFLYDRGLRHERVNRILNTSLKLTAKIWWRIKVICKRLTRLHITNKYCIPSQSYAFIKHEQSNKEKTETSETKLKKKKLVMSCYYTSLHINYFNQLCIQ